MPSSTTRHPGAAADAVQQRSRHWPRLQRAAWAVVLGAGLAMFEITRRAELATDNPRLLPAMVLFGVLVIPAAFLTFVWTRPVRHQVDPVLGLAVSALGGCLSVAVSAVLESDVLRGAVIGTSGRLPAWAVAVLEEGAKVSVCVLVLILLVPRSGINGLLVGVATGTGFAVLETLGYEFAAYVQQQGGMAALDQTLLARGLLAPGTHVAWTGIAGFAVGHAAARRWRPRASCIALVVLAAVVSLHALWDSSPSPATYVSLTVIDLGLLVLCVSVSRDNASRDPVEVQRPRVRCATTTAEAVEPRPNRARLHGAADLRLPDAAGAKEVSPRLP
jgi:RsiW-degrading membrane proteinase PrsW (M82 family)